MIELMTKKIADYCFAFMKMRKQTTSSIAGPFFAPAYFSFIGILTTPLFVFYARSLNKGDFSNVPGLMEVAAMRTASTTMTKPTNHHPSMIMKQKK